MLKGMTKQLDSDLWIIDTVFQGKPGAIASYLLTGDEGLALVDVGPGATVEQLLAGIGAYSYGSCRCGRCTASADASGQGLCSSSRCLSFSRPFAAGEQRSPHIR